MTTIRLTDISVSRGAPATQSTVWRRLGPRLPGYVKRFELHHLTLTVPHGKTLVVLGPSGCGKSTLLRIIAGLDAPDAGRVLFDGKDVGDRSPGDRKIGYLFQNYALYPHLDVEQNITSFFFFRRKTRELIALRERLFRRTADLLDVDIGYLLHRKPSRLSGGEKQRVALGRCITREPELFLLDEPFSNLDAKLRSKYRMHLKTLLREFSITTVYVTHDQQEAVLLGDLVAIMRVQSREQCNVATLEQVGTVRELYDHPGNTFVADFLSLQGDVPAMNFIPGGGLGPALEPYTIGVRPEDIVVDDAGGAPQDEAPPAGRALDAVVGAVREDPLRQYRILTLRVGGAPVTAKVLPLVACEAGQTVPVRFRNYHVFATASGEVTGRTRAIRDALGG